MTTIAHELVPSNTGPTQTIPEQPLASHQLTGHQLTGHQLTGHQLTCPRLADLIMVGLALAGIAVSGCGQKAPPKESPVEWKREDKPTQPSYFQPKDADELIQHVVDFYKQQDTATVRVSRQMVLQDAKLGGRRTYDSAFPPQNQTFDVSWKRPYQLAIAIDPANKSERDNQNSRQDNNRQDNNRQDNNRQDNSWETGSFGDPWGVFVCDGLKCHLSFPSSGTFVKEGLPEQNLQKILGWSELRITGTRLHFLFWKLLVEEPEKALTQDIRQKRYLGVHNEGGRLSFRLALEGPRGQQLLDFAARGDPVLLKAAYSAGPELRLLDPLRSAVLRVSETYSGWSFQESPKTRFQFSEKNLRPIKTHAHQQELWSPHPLVGKPLPPVKLPRAGGQQFDPATLIGRQDYLVYITTGKAPANADQIAGLERCYQKVWEQNVGLYVIFVKTPPQSLSRQLADNQFSGGLVADPAGVITKTWKVPVLPALGAVDQEGVLRYLKPALAADLQRQAEAELAATKAKRLHLTQLRKSIAGQSDSAQLIELLDHEDAQVVVLAEQRLLSLADLIALQEGLTHSKALVRERVLKVLASLGKDASPLAADVAARFGDEDFGVRQRAEVVLAQLGPSAISFLLEALESSNSNERASAARTFRRLGSEASFHLPALLDRLANEEDDYVKEILVQAIGSVGEKGFNSLGNALRDPNEKFHTAAADALLQLSHGVQGIPANQAAQMVVQVGKGALKGGPPHVKQLVLRIALDLPPPLDEDLKQAVRFQEQISKMKERSLSNLLPLVENPNEQIQLGAAAEIATRGRDGVTGLVGLLKNPKPRTRAVAAWAIGEAGEAAAPGSTQNSSESGLSLAVGPLIERLGDSSSTVRQETIGALVKVNPELSLQPLLAALEDRASRSQTARLGLYQVIGKLGVHLQGNQLKKTVEIVAQGVVDSQEDARNAAAGALVKLGPTGIKLLAQILQSSNSEALLQTAAKGLGEGGSEAVPYLTPLLRSRKTIVLVWTMEALADIGPPAKAALPDLRRLRAANNRAVRASADNAIRRIDR